MLKPNVALFTLVVVIGTVGPALGQPGSTDSDNDGPPPFRVAAVHISTDSGARYLRAVNAAHEAHPDGRLVSLDAFGYSTEREGVSRLRELLELEGGDAYDAILGPTESGVLVAAMNEVGEWDAARQVPVISPLVTVEIPVDREGWFFVTNLGVSARAHTAYDYLSKYWIRSITILYADVEFGRSAEDAFRRQLSERQAASYQAFPYDINSNERRELRILMNTRPEAVGIFGERDFISVVAEALPRMNTAGGDYAPRIFTLIDVRDIDTEVDIDFVSLVPNDTTNEVPEARSRQASPSVPEPPHEVYSLAKDTTTLVINTLASLTPPGNGDRSTLRADLRNRLALALSGATDNDAESHTLRFSNFRNHAPAFLLQRRGGVLTQLDLSETVPWPEKIATKYDLIWDRFGPTPFVYIGLCLFVVLATNFISLYRWEKGRWWWVLLRPRAYWLFGGNLVLALVLIVGFAETGAIRYDNLFTMLAIALGPAAFLRSAVQAMPAAETFDANKVYESATRWLTEGAVIHEKRKRERRATYLAYYNKLEDLEREVKDTIVPGLNQKRQARFDAFKDELKEVDNRVDKKRVCARELLRHYSWKQLRDAGFAPDRLDKTAVDPELVIRRGVQHCLNNATREKNLLDLVEAQIGHLDAAVQESYKKEYEEMLDSQPDARGRLWVRFRFLYIRFGNTVDLDSLRKKDLFPRAEPPWYSWRHWFKRNTHKHEGDDRLQLEQPVPKKDASPTAPEE